MREEYFCRNLSFSTTEDELRQMFEPYGQVDRVSIMTDRDTGRSRGFGFVEMASNDDGEKAITALNGFASRRADVERERGAAKTERAGGGDATAEIAVAAVGAEAVATATKVSLSWRCVGRSTLAFPQSRLVRLLTSDDTSL